MARKYDFEKTKYPGIYSLKTVNGLTEYYANFMLLGKSYQKRNLTKMFGDTTAKQAKDRLEEIKSEIRKGNEPFSNSGSNKVKDIVLKSIEDKKTKEGSKYKKNLTSFYNLYIDKHIGKLKMENVKESDVQKILNSIEGHSKSHKLNLRVLMYQLFEDYFRAGKITTNPFYKLDYGKDTGKANFDTRLNEPMEDVAKKLYKTIFELTGPHRLLFLFSIMMVRRIGEVHKLKFGHIKQDNNGEWYVIATPDITKTEITEKYPLPTEIIEVLPSEVLEEEYENENLFSFCYSGIFKKWNEMAKKADIKLHKGHSFTSHDNRHLFLSILSTSLGVSMDLADRCISHNEQDKTGDIYFQVPYPKRKEVFEKWWDFLRNID